MRLDPLLGDRAQFLVHLPVRVEGLQGLRDAPRHDAAQQSLIELRRRLRGHLYDSRRKARGLRHAVVDVLTLSSQQALLALGGQVLGHLLGGQERSPELHGPSVQVQGLAPIGLLESRDDVLQSVARLKHFFPFILARAFEVCARRARASRR